VCKEDQATDWFNALSKCLHWNKRQRQKSFAIVESNRGVHKSTPTTPKHSHHGLSMTPTTTNGNNTPTRGGHSKKGSSSTGSTTNQSSRSPSPPPPKMRSSPTDHSSDGVPDEVFAMFIEDEYLQHGSDGEEQENDVENESKFFESNSEEENDDEFSTQDGFNGWTDQEIIKARFSSKITLKLERLSMSKSP
jgi:hypothetical protein